MKKIFITILSLAFLPSFVSAAPSISGVSGNLTHGSSVTVSGRGFGTKATQNGNAPVAFGDMENNSLSARIGAWSSTGSLGVGSTQNRHQFSHYNAFRNFNGNISPWPGATNDEAAFTGGNDDTTWYVQYWFYLDNDFTFTPDEEISLGNIKIFRMWSTGSDINDFVVAYAGIYDIRALVENVESPYWSPVIPGYNSVDEVMGHGNPGYIGPSETAWRHFEEDITKNQWHLFQFEFKCSNPDAHDGIFRWWYDGKKLMDKSNVLTRTNNSNTDSLVRPKYVGFFDSFHTRSNDGQNHFYIDDAYIDNTFQRIEIGNAGTYSASTHREIQPPTVWNGSSATVTLNQGSFTNGQQAYLYVVDSTGAVNSNGYQIIFGSSGGDTVAPASPGGLSVR